MVFNFPTTHRDSFSKQVRRGSADGFLALFLIVERKKERKELADGEPRHWVSSLALPSSRQTQLSARERHIHIFAGPC